MFVPLSGLTGLGTLDAFAQQIKRVEGYYPPGTPGYPTGSLAYRNNNPGNIRYVTYYANHFGAVPGDGGYARFPTYAIGYEALKHQITLDANRGLTIRQMMAKYAPASDGNDPAGYAATIARALGVSVDTLVSVAIAGGGSAPATPEPSQEPILAGGGGGLFDGQVNIGGVDVPLAAIVAGGAVLTFGLLFALSRR